MADDARLRVGVLVLVDKEVVRLRRLDEAVDGPGTGEKDEVFRLSETVVKVRSGPGPRWNV